MVEDVIQYLDAIFPLQEELKEELRKIGITKTYLKDERVLQTGEIANYASFIVKGLVRSYYIREDGEEITTKFLLENSIITSIFSFFSRKPGVENIVAMEETVMVCFHHDQLQVIYKQYLEMNYVIRVVTEQYLYFLEVEIYNLRKKKAEERYLFFVKHFPSLLQRAPLKHIATYLGMNLETLSRVRGRRL